MRIQQLHLSAFGTFTDKHLDFSQPQGLHIIYGANESGKSTTLRALLALLFGMPERTSDAYLHSNDQLRIGAILRQSSGGQEWQCYRRKGRKNTLLDQQNTPLDDGLIQELLGGISQEQFTALFCLDHERLVKGGENLLSGGGNVGESLFEAGTGNQQLHDLLKELDSEAEELFKARATKPKLNRTIKLYEETKKQIKTLSLSVTHWNEKYQQLHVSQTQHAEIIQLLQQLNAEKQRLARIQRTRPLLQRHQDTVAALANYTHTILLPDDVTTQRVSENLKLHLAQTQIQQSEQIIAELQLQQQQIQLQPEFLDHKIVIENFRERLGSHTKAARDLPGVRTEMRTIENDAQILLQRLYPDSNFENIPRITNPQREKIKTLADEFPILQTRLANAQERLENTKNEVTRYRTQLQDLTQPIDFTELKAAVDYAIKQGDLENSLAKEDKEIRVLTVRIEVALKQLGLWTGSLAELELLSLPSMERIDSFDRKFKELDSDKQRVKEKGTEARHRHAQATQNIEALHWAGEIPTEEKLSQIRQHREQQWQKLKQNPSLMPELGRGYEQLVKEADEVADRLRRESQRVMQQANFKAEQQAAAREQESQTKRWHALNELTENIQSEWEECWKVCAIKPWSPTEMRNWLNSILNLRQQLLTLRERQQQWTAKQQLLVELCQRLTTALQNLPLDIKILTSLSDLITQATTTIEEVTELQRQHIDLNKQIKTRNLECQRGEVALEQINQQMTQWHTSWATALFPLQLPADTSPEIARNVLDSLDELLNKSGIINSLRRRVERMEQDAQVFQQEVATLLQKIAPEWLNESIEQVVPKLSNQLSQIEKDTTRFEQLQQRLEAEQQNLQTAKLQQNQAQAILQSLLEQAHCTQLTELEQAEIDSAQKRILQRIHAEVEQQLLEQGEGLSLIELANAAESVDIDQLPMQLQQISEKIATLEGQRSEFDQKIGELRILLKQMDGNHAAARAAEDAQLYVTEMRELSERYIQVVSSAFVLRQVIEKYRKTYQAPLLQRANELFRRLTLNSFVELKTGYGNDDQPILLGLRTAESMGISTAGMSEGTRDQLYLALRLASIEQYLQHNSPVPLIFDDILVNFDDERSRATLEILSNLSEKTQILFFTHHLRLVELAQKSVGRKRVVIHELGDETFSKSKSNNNPQLSVF